MFHEHDKNIVGDMPCPSCRAIGRDRTGNHLMVFADGNAHCNRCGYSEIQTKASTAADGVHLAMTSPGVSTTVPFDLSAFQAYPIKSLPNRGISRETCELYGVRATVSQTDGQTIQDVLFPLTTKENPEPVGVKTRTPDKNFYLKGESTTDDTFFGYHVAMAALKALPSASRTLYVTEGEFDAMALSQVLSSLSKADKVPPVVSIRHGSKTAARAISNNKELIEFATKVVMVTDNDLEGILAAEQASRVIGTKAHVAKLPMKDANDMLLAGREKELKKAVLEAKRYMPAALATVDDIMDDILAPPEYGISYPWPSLTDLTFGIKRGLLIGVAAGVGIGKTDFFSQLEAHIIGEHKQGVGLFKLEQPPSRSIKSIAGKIAHKPFHRPDVSYNQQELIDTVESLRDYVYVYNHFGFKCWADIKADIRTLTGYGVGFFFIDPLTALISHEKDEHKALNEMMEEMAALTQELNITIFYSSHLNPPDRSSKSHEEGGKVKESQLYGSRAMIRWSHYIFGLERNKHAVDEAGNPDMVERNTTKFVLLKDREHGRTGSFKIYYNPETSDYLEPTEPQSSDKDF